MKSVGNVFFSFYLFKSVFMVAQLPLGSVRFVVGTSIMKPTHGVVRVILFPFISRVKTL